MPMTMEKEKKEQEEEFELSLELSIGGSYGTNSAAAAKTRDYQTTSHNDKGSRQCNNAATLDQHQVIDSSENNTGLTLPTIPHPSWNKFGSGCQTSDARSPPVSFPSVFSHGSTVKQLKKHNANAVPHMSMPMPMPMPCVSATGNGPNSKTITGFLYKYTNNQVRILCVCHGCSFSPAEFVEHAGGVNISNPLRHITVIPSSLGCS